MSTLDDFHEKRFTGVLKALTHHLREHNAEQWADRFESDLADYLDGQGPPRQISRQKAVVEHVLTTFGGMSSFRQVEITNEAGELIEEANERLQFLSTQLWAAGRSMQGVLISAESELRFSSN